MRQALIGTIILGSCFTAAGPVTAQPTNIDDAIAHCRHFGHNDRSCESLCYDMQVHEACQILQNRASNNRRDQLIGGIVSGIVSGVIANSRNRNRQSTQQQVAQQQPATQTVQTAGQFSNEHYKYCMDKYKSYQVATNSYTSFSGRTKLCNSPFD